MILRLGERKKIRYFIHKWRDFLKSKRRPNRVFSGKKSISDMNQEQKIETRKKASNYVKRGCMCTFL